MTALARAARALCAWAESRDDVWDDMSADDRSPYFDMARVVIMAIRDPGYEISEAGWSLLPDIGSVFIEDATSCFNAMTNAILSESDD